MNPKISVITCLYNTPPKLFQKCLNGLHNQTFKDFEVIIVNDGSDKYLSENKKLIESFNDNRFKYFEKEHSGKSQTLNFAIYKCEGKYIAINDSDDISYPERLEYQYIFLENNQSIDAISNAMISYPDRIIFPNNFNESFIVDKNNIHYSANHPSMMFNKDKVLKNTPFLFEQIYDSMEDNVFNHIMFYRGNIKFYFDNTILMQYSKENPNAVHYENTYGYKKEGSYKLFNYTFNAKHENTELTCILLVNSNWKEELEKTLLNIRYTSNNVSILVISYDNTKIDEELNIYDIKVVYAKNICNAISIINDNVETNNIFIIGKPIRFYIQNWDIYINRKFKNAEYPDYIVIQPYMTGIKKIDKNNYYNCNGKDTNYNIRHGNTLKLLSNKLTQKIKYFKLYSEYTDTVQLPILDDDLCFACTKTNLTRILYADGFNNDILLNVYISLKEWLINAYMHIDFDIKCGVIDNFNFNNYLEEEYENKYYINLYKIAYLFFNETRFIYEKIISEKFENKNKAKQIIEDIINDKKLQELKKEIKLFENDMSYFLKNINCKYNPWRLTYAN